MVFTSDVFLFAFLPVVLAIYYALPRYRNEFLTIASYVFYGWWDPRFVLLMMTSTVVDYFAGAVIASPTSGPLHFTDPSHTAATFPEASIR